MTTATPGPRGWEGGQRVGRGQRLVTTATPGPRGWEGGQRVGRGLQADRLLVDRMGVWVVPQLEDLSSRPKSLRVVLAYA